MRELLCKNCGGAIHKASDGSFTCEYCGSTFFMTANDNVSNANDNSFPNQSSSVCKSSNVIHHSILSHNNSASAISIDADVQNLLKKCKAEPHKAKKYANLILDIDPDNQDALKYLK